MENLSFSFIYGLLFVCLLYEIKQSERLYMRVKKICVVLLLAVLFSSVLCIVPSFAADTTTATTTGANSGLFADLISKGIKIFEGMRDIIYVVAGFGIIGVAIGGFFGNINWKWLGAIVIGLMVIGLTGGILTYIGGGDAPVIEDTLK